MKLSRLVVVVIFALTGLSGCYLNPNKIALRNYEAVTQEINQNIKQIERVCTDRFDKTRTVITKDNIPASLKSKLPKTLELLNTDGAELINYSSPKCTFFILKKHEGILNDRFECLKTSNTDCDYFKDACYATETKVELNNRWEYSIIRTYLCE